MKANKILAVAFAALALVGFNSCEKDKPGKDEPSAVSAITLDQTTLKLEIGKTATLVATTDPAGAEVTWTSQNATVATVADGVVTAVADGSTIIVAQAGDKKATCIVNVGKAAEETDFSALLQGSNYYVISLGDKEYAQIEKNVVMDFRVNGAYNDDGTIPAETTSLWEVWGKTLAGGAGGGLNCFGNVEGYTSWKRNDNSDPKYIREEWGNGCGGIIVVHRMVDLSGIDETYTLAIAYKCPANNAKGTLLDFSMGSTTPDGKPEWKQSVNANTDGEWALLEVSIKDILASGVVLDKIDATTDGRWMPLGCVIHDDATNTNPAFDIDAVLIYKK